MKAPLDPRTNESFSDGTSKGFLLVKSVPLLRSCTPTYLETQPTIIGPAPDEGPRLMRLMDNSRYLTVYKNNSPPRTLTMNYDEPSLDGDFAAMLNIFHNEEGTGVAFIAPMDSGPVPMSVQQNSRMGDSEYDDQRDRVSGIGSDGGVLFNTPFDNVLGRDFLFMSASEQFSSNGSFFVPEEMWVSNVQSVKPQQNKLTFTTSPGVPRHQDMFYDMFGEDVGDSVTIHSCAIIEFPVAEDINCTPSGFNWHTYDIDLDVVRNRDNQSEFGKTVITAWVEVNGLGSLWLMTYDDAEVNNGYFTFDRLDTTSDLRWMISNHLSGGGLTMESRDQGYLNELLDKDGMIEFYLTGHFENLGLDRDYEHYSLRGYGAGDRQLLSDKISDMGGYMRPDSTVPEATTIVITRIPDRLKGILFPPAYEMCSHLEFIDVIHSGEDIILESCLRGNLNLMES